MTHGRTVKCAVAFSRMAVDPALHSWCRGLFQQLAHAWHTLGADPHSQDLGGTAGRGLGIAKANKSSRWAPLSRCQRRAYENIILSFSPSSQPHERLVATENSQSSSGRAETTKALVSFQKEGLGALEKGLLCAYSFSLECVRRFITEDAEDFRIFYIMVHLCGLAVSFHLQLFWQ